MTAKSVAAAVSYVRAYTIKTQGNDLPEQGNELA
jgi:hypothetical protein